MKKKRITKCLSGILSVVLVLVAVMSHLGYVMAGESSGHYTVNRNNGTIRQYDVTLENLQGIPEETEEGLVETHFDVAGAADGERASADVNRALGEEAAQRVAAQDIFSFKLSVTQTTAESVTSVTDGIAADKVKADLQIAGDISLADKDVKVYQLGAAVSEVKDVKVNGQKVSFEAGDMHAEYSLVLLNKEVKEEAQEKSAPEEKKEPDQKEESTPTVEPTEETPMVGRSFLRVAPLAADAVMSNGDEEDDGLVIDKTAKANDGGTFTIDLEAYAKGTISITKEAIPADIVLVLDQSGSMTGSFGSGQNKMNALKAAANSFINSVSADAAAKNVNHRVSVIGFASDAQNEVFNGSTGTRYSQAGEDHYNASWKDARTEAATLRSSVTALTASGATNAHTGLAMANRAFQYIPVAEGARNRVVIMFTDGDPNNQSGFDADIANRAITQARYLKADYTASVTDTSGKGATVYSVGVMSNANPADLTANTNRYMHYVSSNYPNATSLTNGGTGSNQGYYLAATNATELNSIFDKIAEHIQTNTVDLDDKAILTDTITEYFKLPNGSAADVKVYTADYKGNDTWGNKTLMNDAQVTVAGNKVTVTNFNYKENFVTDDSNGDGNAVDPKGKKLIVEVTVERADGFIGGNDVMTNTTAGIYHDAQAEEPVKLFPVPDVDVPLLYDFEPQDDGIYIGDSWGELEALITDGTGIPYKTSETGDTYYLGNAVTNQYADVTYTVKNPAGDTIAVYTVLAGQNDGSWEYKNGFDPADNKLTTNTVYTVTADVKASTPKENGVDDKSVDPKNATVYVFRPGITVTDTVIYRNETTDLNERIDTTVNWSSDNLTADRLREDLAGPAPGLEHTFDLVAGTAPGTDLTQYGPALDSDFNVKTARADTKEDISQYTTVMNREVIDHSSCVENDSDTEHHFTVHVRGVEFSARKIDAETGLGLEGVKFELYNASDCTYDSATGTFSINAGATAVTSATSGANGVLEFTGIGVGSYYLVEIDTVEGFELAGLIARIDVTRNGTNWNVSATDLSGKELLATPPAGSSCATDIKNNRLTRDFTFDKTSDYVGADLAGAVFEAVGTTPNGSTSHTVTATSGADGKVTFIGLKYGYTYVVKETTPLGNHELSDQTWIIEVDMNGDAIMYLEGDEDKTEVTEIENEYSNGPLTITKIIDKYEKIDGDAVFTFEITHLETGTVYTESIIFSAGNTPNDGAGNTLSVTIENLPYGTYMVRELETLRYKLVSVDEGSKELNSKAGISFTFENHKTFDDFFSHADFVKNKFTVGTDGGVSVGQEWDTDVPTGNGTR